MSLKDDVVKLINDPSAESRHIITDRISSYYNKEIFNEEENKIAIDVLRLLSYDSEVSIRKLLSENLKNCDKIPHDIALVMANDIAEISMPILQFSNVLTDEDLIKITEQTEQITKLIAIAKRYEISLPLSDALINKKNEIVINVLIQNDGAEISENSLGEIVKKFSESKEILDSLIARGKLPIPIVEHILSLVSEELKNQLINEYKLDKNIADKLISKSYEQEIVKKITMISEEDQEQLINLINTLYEDNKLNDALILRALCKGNIKFFEMALSRLTNINIKEIDNIICNEGADSFASLYKTAKLPKRNFEAVYAFVTIAIQEVHRGSITSKNFANRMMERIIENGYDHKIPSMDYLMLLIKS